MHRNLKLSKWIQIGNIGIGNHDDKLYKQSDMWALGKIFSSRC